MPAKPSGLVWPTVWSPPGRHWPPPSSLPASSLPSRRPACGTTASRCWSRTASVNRRRWTTNSPMAPCRWPATASPVRTGSPKALDGTAPSTLHTDQLQPVRVAVTLVVLLLDPARLLGGPHLNGRAAVGEGVFQVAG